MKLEQVKQEDLELVDIRTENDQQLAQWRKFTVEALELAKLGAFNHIWDKSSSIDGRKPCDIFVENCKRRLEEIDAEILRRKMN
jgi:hypothetical protein